MPKIIKDLRESILQAANEILCEQGFGDFGIRAVAKKLGIAPATIYNYYPSKEAILEALVDNAWHGFLDSIDGELAELNRPVEALERICVLLQGAMNPLFTHWLTSDMRAMPDDHPDRAAIMAKKREISAEFTKRIEALLLRCGQDASFAPVYTRLFIMCAHHGDLSFGDIVSAIKALQ